MRAGHTADSRVLKAKKLFDRERWTESRRLFRAELRSRPADHWLLTRVAMTYYEQHQYSAALKFARRARQLAPWCPLVKWDLATICWMNDRDKEAVKLWKEIAASPIKKLAYGQCGEGVAWASSLVNDARFRLAQSFRTQRQFKRARTLLKRHIAHRKMVDSIFIAAVVDTERRTIDKMVRAAIPQRKVDMKKVEKGRKTKGRSSRKLRYRS